MSPSSPIYFFPSVLPGNGCSFNWKKKSFPSDRIYGADTAKNYILRPVSPSRTTLSPSTKILWSIFRGWKKGKRVSSLSFFFQGRFCNIPPLFPPFLPIKAPCCPDFTIKYGKLRNVLTYFLATYTTLHRTARPSRYNTTRKKNHHSHSRRHFSPPHPSPTKKMKKGSKYSSRVAPSPPPEYEKEEGSSRLY